MTINERLQLTIENLDLQGYVMSDDIEHLTNILEQLKLGSNGESKYE